MQVQLFKALQSINIPDDVATQVVEKLESHIAMKVSDANKALESKIDTTNRLIVVIGFILTALTTFGVAATAWSQLVR